MAEYVDLNALADNVAVACAQHEPAVSLIVSRGCLAWLCRTLRASILDDGRVVEWHPDQSDQYAASYNGAAGMAWELLKNYPGNPLQIAADAPLHEVERMVLAHVGVSVEEEESDAG